MVTWVTCNVSLTLSSFLSVLCHLYTSSYSSCGLVYHTGFCLCLWRVLRPCNVLVFEVICSVVWEGSTEQVAISIGSKVALWGRDQWHALALAIQLNLPWSDDCSTAYPLRCLDCSGFLFLWKVAILTRRVVQWSSPVIQSSSPVFQSSPPNSDFLNWAWGSL